METFIELPGDRRIRIAPNDYKGRIGVDIRCQYKDPQGDWQFTKKGVTVNKDQVKLLIAGIKKAL